MAFWNWFKGKEKKEREDEDALEELQAQESEFEADEALEAEKNGKLIDSLFSVYDIDGTEIFIITEIDRSVTTILFPDEY